MYSVVGKPADSKVRCPIFELFLVFSMRRYTDEHQTTLLLRLKTDNHEVCSEWLTL